MGRQASEYSLSHNPLRVQSGLTSYPDILHHLGLNDIGQIPAGQFRLSIVEIDHCFLLSCKYPGCLSLNHSCNSGIGVKGKGQVNRNAKSLPVFITVLRLCRAYQVIHPFTARHVIIIIIVLTRSSGYTLHLQAFLHTAGNTVIPPSTVAFR